MARTLFIGRSTIDVGSVVETFPAEDGKIVANQTYIHCGGTSFNAAATHAYLGGEAILATSIGVRSPLVPLMLSELNELGIRVMDICRDDAFELPVSTIISTISTSSRLIVNTPLAESRKVLHVPDIVDSALSSIQLDQYERAFVAEHADFIKGFKGSVILDGGAWKDWSSDFLDLATLPIVSEEFFPGGPAAFAKECLARGIEQWALTRGSRGVVFYDHGTTCSIEAPKVNASDTSGAGDIFHGAFCYYFGLGIPFGSALEAASEIAAESCKFIGTRAWRQFSPVRAQA